MGAAAGLDRARILVLVLVVCVLSVWARAQPLPHLAPEGPQSTSVSENRLNEIDSLTAQSESLAHQRQILVMLDAALAAEPTNYPLLWRAMRAHYKVGDAALQEDKAAIFERGIGLGQRAVAVQPAGVEGHFWLGANYGGLSEVQGMFKALKTVQKIRAEMQTVLQLQADYAQGDAYRALGEIERQLPGILGGSLKRAIAYLEQGRQVAPENLAMQLALAKAYRDAGRAQDSQQLLNAILQTPVRPERAQADHETQDKARQLLAQ